MSGEAPTGSIAEIVERLGAALSQVQEASVAVQAMKQRVVDAQAVTGGALDGTSNQQALDGMEALALANVELDGVTEGIQAGKAAAAEYVASIGGVLDIQI